MQQASTRNFARHTGVFSYVRQLLYNVVLEVHVLENWTSLAVLLRKVKPCLGLKKLPVNLQINDWFVMAKLFLATEHVRDSTARKRTLAATNDTPLLSPCAVHSKITKVTETASNRIFCLSPLAMHRRQRSTTIFGGTSKVFQVSATGSSLEELKLVQLFWWAAGALAATLGILDWTVRILAQQSPAYRWRLSGWLWTKLYYGTLWYIQHLQIPPLSSALYIPPRFFKYFLLTCTASSYLMHGYASWANQRTFATQFCVHIAAHKWLMYSQLQH